MPTYIHAYAYAYTCRQVTILLHNHCMCALTTVSLLTSPLGA